MLRRSAKGSYHGPAMNGSKGGVFNANLRKVSEHPKYSLKTLAYHEGIPGHHFQLGIQTELKGLPIVRTIAPVTAYAGLQKAVELLRIGYTVT